MKIVSSEKEFDLLCRVLAGGDLCVNDMIDCPEMDCKDDCYECFKNKLERVQDDEPAFGTWIPVSEKEPKEYQCVLVQLSTEPLPTHDLAVYHKEYGYRPWYSEYFQEGAPEWEEGKVVAWMSLPAPYKEGKDEKNPN